jgi:hypothetical protein
MVEEYTKQDNNMKQIACSELTGNRRMASSGMLRRVALVRTDGSEELEWLSSSETSVLTGSTRRNMPEDVILHSHRLENLKSYITGNRMREF